MHMFVHHCQSVAERWHSLRLSDRRELAPYLHLPGKEFEFQVVMRTCHHFSASNYGLGRVILYPWASISTSNDGIDGVPSLHELRKSAFPILPGPGLVPDCGF